MNEMYIKSVLQQASQMMSRGEDHLLNTIQVYFSLYYLECQALPRNNIFLSDNLINLKLLKLWFYQMSQSKCKANLSIGSDQKYKDTNIITNLYAQILDINTKTIISKP